ncbi:MAG: hypothetical protein AAGK05_12610, partial [Pseudomonadota bacterium]
MIKKINFFLYYPISELKSDANLDGIDSNLDGIDSNLDMKMHKIHNKSVFSICQSGVVVAKRKRPLSTTAN